MGVTTIEQEEGGDRFNETAQEALNRRIEILQSVQGGIDGWRNVILGRDENNFCSQTEICAIRQRAMFLCCAYKFALANMNRETWHSCYKQACTMLNGLGMKQATFYKTVANWNTVSRRFEGFPHSNPCVQCGKRPLPHLLEVYPSAKDPIVWFGLKNLASLTIESMHDFMLSSVIPRIALTWKKENLASTTTNNSCNAVSSTTATCTTTISSSDEDDTTAITTQDITTFLNAHKLESLSLSTTHRWMHLLGFDHDSRKKSFYVDGHERADVVMHREIFCTCYLTEWWKPRCKRWVHLSVEEAKQRNLDLTFGYTYHDIIGNEDRLEYHIDYWNKHLMIDGQEQKVIPPTTSIRISSQTRPLMIIGQDESVFAQYLLESKTWVGPKGQRPMFPKGEGDGYMLSAFVAREFGFGREMTAAELEKVNKERQGANKTYINTTAALEILKVTEKPLLTESPFVKYLYIGANNEGYWNSYHMSLQFEDVVDCLQILYPEFELLFLFDHSQGHARKRDGALSAIHMSRTYGGAQAVMRDTKILEANGYLGTNVPRQLNAEDTQSMVFQPEDSGP